MPTTKSVSVNIPLPAEGNCVPCCGPKLTITCHSWSATPTLVGFSGYDTGGYDAGNPTAWEGYGRKWRVRTIAGTFYDRTGAGCDYERKYVYVGDVEIGVTGYVAYGTFSSFRKDAPDCTESAITSYDETGIGEASGASVGVGAACGGGTQVARTVASLVQCDFAGCAPANWDGAGSELLSVEDTIEDAIDRESPSEDDPPSCCAETGIIDTTSPESTSPISVGPSMRSEPTLELTGAPSTTYVVTFTFSNSVLSTSAPLPDTTEEIEITTDGAGEAEMDYRLPQPGSDRRRCLIGYEIEVAP